jgi:hypothetical protein
MFWPWKCCVSSFRRGAVAALPAFCAICNPVKPLVLAKSVASLPFGVRRRAQRLRVLCAFMLAQAAVRKKRCWPTNFATGQRPGPGGDADMCMLAKLAVKSGLRGGHPTPLVRDMLVEPGLAAVARCNVFFTEADGTRLVPS